MKILSGSPIKSIQRGTANAGFFVTPVPAQKSTLFVFGEQESGSQLEQYVQAITDGAGNISEVYIRSKGKRIYWELVEYV